MRRVINDVIISAGVRRYGRRPGQPSSSSLARRASVHFDFVRVRVFIEYMAIDALKFASTPGPFGGRGDTPRWGLMAGAAACCAQFFRCSPFSFPVQPQSTELPATTEGRWRRRPPLARTQGRTVGCILNLNFVGPF